MARNSYYKINRGNKAFVTPQPTTGEQTTPQSAQTTAILLPVPAKSLTPTEIRARISTVLSHYRYDPIQELVRIAQGADTPMDTKVAIAKELAKYVAPQLKSLDVHVEGEMNITVNVLKFTDTSGKLAPRTEVLDIPHADKAS